MMEPTMENLAKMERSVTIRLQWLEMMIEVGGHPLAQTDGNLHLSYS